MNFLMKHKMCVYFTNNIKASFCYYAAKLSALY